MLDEDHDVQPIPQTVDAAHELGRWDPDLDLLGYLQATADRIQVVVPDCIGLSIAWLDQGIVFTLVASDEEIAALDAVQYVDGGPCVDGAREDRGIRTTRSDLLDEETWRIFGLATAAHGVGSTLTIPLTRDGAVIGSANLYGASSDSFHGSEVMLATILGGRVPDIVRNSDLSFSTRRSAERSAQTLRDQALIDAAVGLLVAAKDVDPTHARLLLEDAAARAGISPEQFARALVALYE